MIEKTMHNISREFINSGKINFQNLYNDILLKKIIVCLSMHGRFLPFYQKNPYQKFFVTQNCIMKGSINIYFFI